MMLSRLVATLAFALAMPLQALPDPAVVPTEVPQTYGTNLVYDGDGELVLGAPDNSTIVPPSGWTTTGQLTLVRYGAAGGFPTATSPGPKDRGKNLFEGGNVAKSTGSQTILLSTFATDIDAAKVPFTFSAWLGGYAAQEDGAVVSIEFRDASDNKLAAYSLGPVAAKMRKSATGSLYVDKLGSVPTGTRSAVVSIVITRVEGTYNDGSADNVSLVLTKPQ